MTKQDNLYIGQESRERLMKGVKKAAEVVGSTMGTGGANGLVECIERPGHFATNDGLTLLENMKFSDPLEEIGRQIVYEAVSRSNKQSGDGSSTATVLTAAILEEGQKYLDKYSPLEIKRSLENCLSFIESSIEEQTKKIELNEVGAVASVSAEDEEIGERIQEIYEKIGKEGVIQWDISKTIEDTYEIGTGIRIFGTSIPTSYMNDFDSKGRPTKQATLKNPHVLLAKRKVTAYDLDPICKELFEMGEREFLIFTEEMDVDVLGGLLQLQMKNGFRTVVIKMPVLWKDEWWEDLSLTSGGKIVDSLNHKLEFGKLGRFGRVKITSDETIIEGIQDISKHILSLKVDGSDEALQRAERLNVKTARYFVGAASETALAYRRYKVEDAINSASCALENGIVPGGGLALYNASLSLPKDEIGGKILEMALVEPMRWILSNAKGGEVSGIGGTKGFNSLTGKVEDLFKAQVVDAKDVVLNAIKNAIGVAATILTASSVITLPREEKDVQL